MRSWGSPKLSFKTTRGCHSTRSILIIFSFIGTISFIFCNFYWYFNF